MTSECRQQMLGLIFPEKLVFDNFTFQTVQPNEILELLCCAGEGFSDIKKEKGSENAAPSYVVTHIGRFSNQLLERFKKIYELKETIYAPE